MKAELDDSQPIFQQIADIIAIEIVEGNLEEEEKVPSENELSEFYSVNRATVRKGIQFLVDKEIIYKQRGIGMFVTKGARSILLKERGKEYKKEYIRPMLEEARRIGITIEEIIGMIKKEDT